MGKVIPSCGLDSETAGGKSLSGDLAAFEGATATVALGWKGDLQIFPLLTLYPDNVQASTHVSGNATNQELTRNTIPSSNTTFARPVCFIAKNMRSLLSIFLCLFAVSSICAQASTKRPSIKQTRPPDSNPQYFPVGLFSKYPELSEWEARWYASELRQLREPSLLERKNSRGYSVYRFLLIPSFSPSLVIRLVVNPDGTGTLAAKLSANSRGEDENAPQEQTLTVSFEQVNEFFNMLHEADFWSLPTAKSGYGLDGEEWLLEAKRNGKYRVVDRWSGSMEATYSRACNYLQELSPLKVERRRRRHDTTQESAPTPD